MQTTNQEAIMQTTTDTGATIMQTTNDLLQRAILAELETGALDALREVQTAFERAAQQAHDSDDPRYNEAATLDRIAAGIDAVWRDACRNINRDHEAVS